MCSSEPLGNFQRIRNSLGVFPAGHDTVCTSIPTTAPFPRDVAKKTPLEAYQYTIYAIDRVYLCLKCCTAPSLQMLISVKLGTCFCFRSVGIILLKTLLHTCRVTSSQRQHRDILSCGFRFIAVWRAPAVSLGCDLVELWNSLKSQLEAIFSYHRHGSRLVGRPATCCSGNCRNCSSRACCTSFMVTCWSAFIVFPSTFLSHCLLRDLLVEIPQRAPTESSWGPSLLTLLTVSSSTTSDLRMGYPLHILPCGGCVLLSRLTRGLFWTSS